MKIERLFNQAFGEHTGISEDCRESIDDIKNDHQFHDDHQTFNFRLVSTDAERFTDLAWRLLGQYITNATLLDELDFDTCGLSN